MQSSAVQIEFSTTYHQSIYSMSPKQGTKISMRKKKADSLTTKYFGHVEAHKPYYIIYQLMQTILICVKAT